MCGRYRHTQAVRDLEGEFSQLKIPIRFPAGAIPNLEPTLDVRPTNTMPIVRLGDDGAELVMARWWLVPFWYKGPLKGFKLTTFNARSEDVTSKPAFREAFKRRRCLVPADGWYEWTGEKGAKVKWYFRPRDEPWTCFAGLWDRCQTEDAATVESFAIVTQPAGSPLNGYHDRAPVVLERQNWAAWLYATADVNRLIGPESAGRFLVEPA